MVGIITNRPEYRNDIAEEIMLFLGIVETALLDEPHLQESGCTLVVNVQLQREGRAYRLLASAGGETMHTAFSIANDEPMQVKKHEKRQIKLIVFALLRRLYPDVETPWGSLTGIRPTKLFRELAAEGGEAAAREQFLQVFDVSPEKLALAEEICRVQRPMVESVRAEDIDIYIGIPFCRTRCLYCSFASEVLRGEALFADYLAALRTDIEAGAALVRQARRRVRAMYIGGGTPTVLTAGQLSELLAFALNAYGGFGTECTVEAGRPDTIDREKLAVLRDFGVRRISINPQTMNDETLSRIGRAHTVQETVDAFMLARDVGFDCINMDVIAGLPGEGTGDMARTCEAIAKLQPDNLTVHALAIKRSSRLKAQMDAYPLPSAEDASRMIDTGRSLAETLAMRPYYMYRQKYMRGNLENVGYARAGTECIYNVDMMEETASILSHGAGAMTKRVFSGEHRIERLPAPKDVPTYIGKLPQLLEEKRRFFLD